MRRRQPPRTVQENEREDDAAGYWVYNGFKNNGGFLRFKSLVSCQALNIYDMLRLHGS